MSKEQASKDKALKSAYGFDSSGFEKAAAVS